MDEQRYAPPKANLDQPAAVPAAYEVPAGEPAGLGGWLILVGIGLVLSPLRIARDILSVYVPMFRDGTWARITSSGDPSYHPMWAPVLCFEIAGNVLLLIVVTITLVLFFRKSRRTPRFYIGWLSGAVAFAVTDHLLMGLIPAVAEQAGGESMLDVIRGGVAAAIWVPYFMVSKRVKNTFVR